MGEIHRRTQVSQFFFLLRTLSLYKFPPAAVYKTKVGGGGRLFLTRRPLTSTCAVLSIREDIAHKPHISFPSCTVAPLSCLFLPTQHTPFIFDSYPSIDLPALFHRLPCPPLLHLDDHHMVVEGVLKGRGRRVWCGIPWQRARWGKTLPQDTRQANYRIIVTTSSRPASFMYCFFPPALQPHLASTYNLSFMPDALYQDHHQASSASHIPCSLGCSFFFVQ